MLEFNRLCTLKPLLPVIMWTNLASDSASSGCSTTQNCSPGTAPTTGKGQKGDADLQREQRPLYQDLLTVLLLATNISIFLKASTSVSSDKAPRVVAEQTVAFIFKFEEKKLFTCQNPRTGCPEVTLCWPLLWTIKACQSSKKNRTQSGAEKFHCLKSP